jgi:hypothetical protein
MMALTTGSQLYHNRNWILENIAATSPGCGYFLDGKKAPIVLLSLVGEARYAAFALIRSNGPAFAHFWQCWRLINCGAFGRMVIFRTAT